jgi:hypothetical protein
MPDEQLAVQLLQHLRAALEIATQTGDESATYFVRRALAVCLLRWKDTEKRKPPKRTT